MRVEEIYRSLGLDPRKVCMTITGFKEVESTTMDEPRDLNRTPLGNGCYKCGRGPGLNVPFNPNIKRPTRRRG